MCPPLCPSVGRQLASRLLCSARLAQHSDCLPCPCPALTGFSRASVPHASIVSNLLFVTSDGTLKFVGSSIGACIQVMVMSTISHTLSWDRLSRIIRSRAKKLCRVGQHTSGRLSFANSRTQSPELSSSLDSSCHLTSIADSPSTKSVEDVIELSRTSLCASRVSFGAPRTFSPQFVGKFIRERSNLLVATSIVGFLRLVTNVELRRLWLFFPGFIVSRQDLVAKVNMHEVIIAVTFRHSWTSGRSSVLVNPFLRPFLKSHASTPSDKSRHLRPTLQPHPVGFMHALSHWDGAQGSAENPQNSCCRRGKNSRLKLQELVSFVASETLTHRTGSCQSSPA